MLGLPRGCESSSEDESQTGAGEAAGGRARETADTGFGLTQTRCAVQTLAGLRYNSVTRARHVWAPEWKSDEAKTTLQQFFIFMHK